MPSHHEVEAEVRSTAHALLHAWAQIGEAGIEDLLSYVADDLTGLGSAPGEYFSSKDALRASMKRQHAQLEQAQMAFHQTLEVPWMNVRVLHSALALAEGEMKVDVHSEATTHVLAPRFSLLLERRDGRWLLIYVHFSFPDAQHSTDDILKLLMARNQELEREVARRTAELNRSLADLKSAQAQLIQQEKLASFGALAAGIAHEIKNPLNFVNNFAALSAGLTDELDEQIDFGAPKEELKHITSDLRLNVQRIEAHGKRADRIVRSMLDHNRGASEEHRRVDVNALVEEYVGLAFQGLRAQKPAMSAHVERDYAPEAGEMEVAPEEIGRVVLNLLSNAFYAVHERSARTDERYAPTVRVSTRRSEAGVEIRVWDNGGGIPAEIRSRIFEPFFTTRRTGQGTGLGLSLSYDIVVQRHGGTLAVEVEEGERSEFIVRLPARAGTRAVSQGHSPDDLSRPR